MRRCADALMRLEPVAAVVSWHRRQDGDPAHRWLRERIGDVLAGLLV